MSTQFSVVWPVYRTLLHATTPGQSGSESTGNKEVFSIPQSPSITGVSPSDCLMSYPGHSLDGVLPFCRDAVGVFCSLSRLCCLFINLLVWFYVSRRKRTHPRYVCRQHTVIPAASACRGPIRFNVYLILGTPPNLRKNTNKETEKPQYSSCWEINHVLVSISFHDWKKTKQKTLVVLSQWT